MEMDNYSGCDLHADVYGRDVVFLEFQYQFPGLAVSFYGHKELARFYEQQFS